MGNYLYLVLIYILILFIISAFFIKKTLNSFEEYGYCGRSLSIGFIFFTYLGTWIGGGTIIGLMGRGFEYGASQYWIIALSCIVELIFAMFFIRKIRESELKSITDFFADRYPSEREVVRIPSVIAVLIRNVTMIAMQFSALSYLITFIFGINRNLALLLVFLVLISYTMMSGLWGVAVTDMFQGLIQTVGLLSLGIITYKMCGGINLIQKFYDSEGMIEHMNLFHFNGKWYMLIIFIIAYGLFFLMNDQTSWERIYASKSDNTAKWGFAIPLVITMLMLVGIVYTGVFQRVVMLDSNDSGYIVYDFLFTIMQSKWSILILVAIIASIMSTADSFLLASGVIISEDIIKKFIIKDATDKELIFYTRVFLIVTGSMAFAFSLHMDDILGIWMNGIGMTSVVLVPGYFMGWMKRRPTTKPIITGMIFGILYDAVMMLTPLSIGAVEICIGIGINLLITGLAMAMEKAGLLSKVKRPGGESCKILKAYSIDHVIFAGGGGNVKTSMLIFSVFASWMWTTSIIGAVETYSTNGILGPISYVGSACIAFFIYVMLINFIRNKVPNGNTFVALMGNVYGGKAKIIFYSFAFIVPAYVLIEQAVGVAYVLNLLLDFNFKFVAFACIIVAIIFIAITGMRGLLKSEKIIGITILIVFVFIAGYFMNSYTSASVVKEINAHEAWFSHGIIFDSIKYFIISVVVAFSQLAFDPAYYFKGQLAKNEKQFKMSFYVGGILLWGSISLIASVYLGVASYIQNIEMMKLFAGTTSVVFAFIMMLIGTGTIAHYLMGWFGIFTTDLYTTVLRPDADEKSRIVFGRLLMIAGGLFCAFIAVSLENISLLTIDVFCAIFFAAPCGPLVVACNRYHNAIKNGSLNKNFSMTNRHPLIPALATFLGISFGLIIWIALSTSVNSGYFIGVLGSFGISLIASILGGGDPTPIQKR